MSISEKLSGRVDYYAFLTLNTTKSDAVLMPKSFFRALVLITISGYLLLGCATHPELSVSDLEETQTNNQLVSVEKISAYPSLIAKIIVWIAGMSDRVPVSYGVDLYRLTYKTSNEFGEQVEASGLMSIPRTDTFKGALSWQHGTSVSRNQVPSTPTPDEGVLASIAFAGHGYILLAPDYVGLGVSQEEHSYYHAPTAAANIRDLITAARTAAISSQIEWPEQLFLAGFSQGAFNTLAATRDIEERPIEGMNLIAAASIAGPFDLAGFSVPNALRGESTSASLYLGYMLNSYARIYDQSLSSVFREPFATTVPVTFSGDLSGDEVISALPVNPRDLFLEEVLNEYDQGNFGWLGERLQENSIQAFIPRTPVRLYYGNLDVDVSPKEALDQVARWQQAGLDVLAVDVGPVDHNGSVIESAPEVRDWFDGFLSRTSINWAE